MSLLGFRVDIDSHDQKATATDTLHLIDWGWRGVLWTCSIFPLFGRKRVRGTVLPPIRRGNGHELTPDSLPADRGALSA
jgi:hypothetical protein